MKKVILTYCFLFLATFLVKAQDVTVNPSAPDIKFKATTHDYGTIMQDADGNCEFKFTNTGKEPLILASAVGSCGCTVPTFSKEPVMPGKEGAIKVHYDTHRIGSFTKTVTVTSNAKTDRVVLTIQGTVNAKPAEQSTTPAPAPATTTPAQLSQVVRESFGPG
jgi:hypothetical protein